MSPGCHSLFQTSGVGTDYGTLPVFSIQMPISPLDVNANLYFLDAISATPMQRQMSNMPMLIQKPGSDVRYLDSGVRCPIKSVRNAKFGSMVDIL
jgi:hypothetical protein